MPIHKNALWGAIGLLMVQPLLTQGAHAQQSRKVPAYDKALTRGLCSFPDGSSIRTKRTLS